MLVRHEQRGIVWYSFGVLDGRGFLRNWVTTRLAGFSKFGFNLGGREEDMAAVRENLRLAEELFSGGRAIFLPLQVHGSSVHQPETGEEPKCAADAVLIKKPYLPSGILTADCLPLILADPVNKTAALIHAGRKGIFENIIAKTVLSMGSNPKDLVATVGPGIRVCCYEVKEDVFEGESSNFRDYFVNGRLDLAKAARNQLLAAGIMPENIHDCRICTSCHTEEFYSHRKEKGLTGRFMTGVMLLK